MFQVAIAASAKPASISSYATAPAVAESYANRKEVGRASFAAALFAHEKKPRCVFFYIIIRWKTYLSTLQFLQIIDKDPRRGVELHRSLLKKAGYGTDIGRRKQEEEAEKYRDQLIRADRDKITQKFVFLEFWSFKKLDFFYSRILDLDSDYYNVETSEYLTADERQRIQRRKDELKHSRAHRARRTMVMDIDFAAATVRDTTAANSEQENCDDPVIVNVLQDAEKRRAREQAAAYKHRDPNLPNAAKFAPTVCSIFPENKPNADRTSLYDP